MVSRWCPHCRKPGGLWRLVCLPGIGNKRVSAANLSRITLMGTYSDVTRVLIFNCTHGRSGLRLLTALRAGIQKKLMKDGSNISPDELFGHVIFCTNVTYMNGEYNRGVKPCFAPLNTSILTNNCRDGGKGCG